MRGYLNFNSTLRICKRESGNMPIMPSVVPALNFWKTRDVMDDQGIGRRLNNGKNEK
jgi:hypothetical protein